MTYLSLVLIAKIAVSIVLLVIPFLFLPKAKLEKVLNVQAETSTLFRLYGMAISALLVAYASGIFLAENGVFPWGIAFMGILSNIGGASVLMFTGSFRNQYFSTVFFATIGVCLAISVLAPSLALTRVF